MILSVVSAAEIFILQQSVTGAVRNFVVVSILCFAAVYTCRGWLEDTRTVMLIAGLGVLSSFQAFIPDFVMPVAAFGVLLALKTSAYLGVWSVMLFSALPFLATERSYEFFLFYAAAGLIGISLIYSRRKSGKYSDVLTVFILVYVMLYTGLIVLKRMSVSPELIIAPMFGLILNVVIMEISGYSYYNNIVKKEADLYLSVADPEHPLLIKLRNNNKREYKRAIHTAHYTDLFAERFGYDRVLMKCLGFYHRIGVLREDDSTPLAIRTVALVMEEGFPEDIIEALKQYGEVKAGDEVSAEVSITVIVDTVISRLMDEFSKKKEGDKDPDLNKFIDKIILGLFSGKNSLLKKSGIPYNDLEEIRKHLKGEKIYYDFLR